MTDQIVEPMICDITHNTISQQPSLVMTNYYMSTKWAIHTYTYIDHNRQVVAYHEAICQRCRTRLYDIRIDTFDCGCGNKFTNYMMSSMRLVESIVL